ncbi:MAG: mannosyltransferase family protein [Nostocaceae cyanobacterium]|nr:mannosyltransferase family protein [Nostocaceae cyanobacterium]
MLASQDPKIGHKHLLFPIVIWLSSRLFIAIAMLLIAPLLPTPSSGEIPKFGWDVFFAWDSKFYEKIVTIGYDYAPDSKDLVSVAFFPLFPLFIRILMFLGLPFKLAGTLVNNGAFLGALIVLYAWINERHGISAARWTTAVLAWCPLSLFATVIYTEGLYLFFSTDALRAFDRQEYAWMAIWGAMATASRPTGIALVLSLLLVVFWERKGTKAYIASLAAGGGLFLFSLYCQIQFGDALAFLDAQKAWRPQLGFDWLGWLKMLMQIIIGSTNWKYGYIKDPWHPVLFAIIVVSGYCLWHWRKQLGAAKVDYGFACLALLLWLLAGDPLTNVVIIVGGIYLLWLLRTELTLITFVYGVCALGILVASGGTISLNRLAYGIVSLSVALGLLLARHHRWGYAVMGLFSILLASFAIRFAQNQWVA